MCRRSSSSVSTPSRITPPSRARAGGSSSSACSSVSRSSGRSSSSAVRLRISGACSSASSGRTRGTTPSETFNATRSRGPATPSAARATRRSRSWTAFNASRNFARSIPRKASSSTASRRSRMGSSSSSGRRSHDRRSRPPIDVTVASSSSSSDPARPPSRAFDDPEVLDRGGIDEQVVGLLAQTDGADVREVGFLRVAQMRDQPARRLNRRGPLRQPEAIEAGRAQLVGKRPLGRGRRRTASRPAW